MKAKGILTETKANEISFSTYGDYAGEYEYDVYQFMNENYPEIIEELSGDNSWCDIMVDDKFNKYAVIAEDSLTTNGKAYFIEIEK